jgi:hypothetical protein
MTESDLKMMIFANHLKYARVFKIKSSSNACWLYLRQTDDFPFLDENINHVNKFL